MPAQKPPTVAANKLRIREIQAEIRAINTEMKARWHAEKPQALAALERVRAMTKQEREILLHGRRLPGESLANAVLRRLRLQALIFRAFAPPHAPIDNFYP